MLNKETFESMKSSKLNHPDCKENEKFIGYIPQKEINSLIEASESPIRFGFPIPCGFYGAIYPVFIVA